MHHCHPYAIQIFHFKNQVDMKSRYCVIVANIIETQPFSKFTIFIEFFNITPISQFETLLPHCENIYGPSTHTLVN